MPTRTLSIEITYDGESRANFDKLAIELFKTTDKVLTLADPDTEYEIKVEEVE